MSPEIRANTNLRVALRVTDPAESLDVIDGPDSAFIPPGRPGRAHARTGATRLVAFQAARVGGPRPADPIGPAISAQPVGWADLGRAPAAPPVSDTGGTDLAVLVDAATQAAARCAATPPPSPWLAPLPALLAAPDQPAGPLTAEFGLEDLPAEQAQRPVSFDLVTGVHLLVAGSARSGRSTLLRTIAGQLARATRAADLRVAAVDCGNGALAPLAELPHTIAVAAVDQPQRVDRLLGRLDAEVTARQRLLAAGGFADLTEQRNAVPAGQRLPYLLLLVDRWEGFTAAFDDLDGGRLIAQLLRLLHEGRSTGLRAVIAGDRSALLGRLASLIEDRLVLRLADRSDYSLAGITARQLPATVPPGRAFRADTAVAVQVAVLGGDASGAAQSEALRQICQQARHRDAGLPDSQRPAPMAELPTMVEPDLLAPHWGRPGRPAPLWVLAGVGGDRCEAIGVDLAQDGPGFVIAGPKRSGRPPRRCSMSASDSTTGPTAPHLTSPTHDFWSATFPTPQPPCTP